MLGNTSDELQHNIEELDRACLAYGMKISVSKTKVMQVGKNRKSCVCSLNGCVLEQVREFKYLGCIFSENAKLDREIEVRKGKGNVIASQLRAHVFNKKELSSETKLVIHQSIFRPTVLYGSESWVDCGYLIHDLEVADMNVLRMIAGTSRRDQWENRISNDDIRTSLCVNSVDEAARINRLRWFGQVQRMDDSRLPKKVLNEEVIGIRSRGRPRRRFLDSVKDDLRSRELVLNDELLSVAQNKNEWKKIVQGV